MQDVELTIARGHWSAAAPPPPWLALPPPGLELRAAFGAGVNDTRPAFHALAHALSALVAAAVPTLAERGVLAAPTLGWVGGRAGVR